eukprot:scaffold2940_cov128-Isochrysis_galbana.AAC.3
MSKPLYPGPPQPPSGVAAPPRRVAASRLPFRCPRRYAGSSARPAPRSRVSADASATAAAPHKEPRRNSWRTRRRKGERAVVAEQRHHAEEDQAGREHGHAGRGKLLHGLTEPIRRQSDCGRHVGERTCKGHCGQGGSVQAQHADRDHEPEEPSIVAAPDALAHPWTVVIKPVDADVALGAVRGARRAPDPAGRTPLERYRHAIDLDNPSGVEVGVRLGVIDGRRAR